MFSPSPSVRLLAALSIAEIAAAFETSMIYASIKKLNIAFGDPVAVGWLISAYMLVGAGCAAVIGRLGDLYGRRRIVIFLLACGALGSLISLLFDAYFAVLVGRGLQGLTAALLPLCFGIIREHQREHQVPVSVGIMTSAAGLGAVIGLLGGGYLVDNYYWKSIFVASSILAVVGVAIVIAWVPPDRKFRVDAQIGWLSGVLFVPAVTLILLAVSNSKSLGWSSLTLQATLVLGVFCLLGWIRASLVSTNPLVDIRLFANRNVAVACLVISLLALGALNINLFFSYLMQAPIWSGAGLGLTATVAALYKLPANFVALAGGPISGLLMSRFGNRTPLVLTLAVIGLGWGLAYIFHEQAWQVAVVLIVIAIGTAMVFTVTSNLVVNAVSSDQTSAATGLLVVVRTTVAAFGAQLIAVILALDTVADPNDPSVRFPSAQSFHSVMLGVAMVTLFASVFALALRERRKSDNSSRGGFHLKEGVG